MNISISVLDVFAFVSTYPPFIKMYICKLQCLHEERQILRILYDKASTSNQLILIYRAQFRIEVGKEPSAVLSTYAVEPSFSNLHISEDCMYSCALQTCSSNDKDNNFVQICTNAYHYLQLQRLSYKQVYITIT